MKHLIYVKNDVCVLIDWTGKDEDDKDVNVWEDNWDDDNVEDDFNIQLRSEDTIFQCGLYCFKIILTYNITSTTHFSY